jgi:hypothetical protein
MLKLSEAMRLGAMLSQQSYDIAGPGRCAFQAAADAVGEKSYGAAVRKHWPWVDANQLHPCPHCGVRGYVAPIISIHLNDEHHWTRERIADWVQTIEDAQVVSVRPDADQADVSLGIQADTVLVAQELRP